MSHFDYNILQPEMYKLEIHDGLVELQVFLIKWTVSYIIFWNGDQNISWLFVLLCWCSITCVALGWQHLEPPSCHMIWEMQTFGWRHWWCRNVLPPASYCFISEGVSDWLCCFCACRTPFSCAQKRKNDKHFDSYLYLFFSPWKAEE